MDILRPAAYARAHRSGPRRARDLAFRLFSEVVHRFVDDVCTCAFGDRVPSAQNPRRPGVVALEYRRGGERDQRVDERELVMELREYV